MIPKSYTKIIVESARESVGIFLDFDQHGTKNYFPQKLEICGRISLPILLLLS